ncbi:MULTISPECIES: BamA/TamA family outer membrane protein [Cyanophyceae]|uniref:BamA/TamA family outer membrane protein n=1 Tax=Cyanophyceae TaxID=3028117 RepID=UPI00016DC513|nr:MULTISPECIES: BamA/TamA family outer membrane protein [Cyanophyceae]ACA98328.1 outer membrane protein, OMP85 family [Picosynechococcus sp. PCC 7002]SMH45938.1 outer membrane protein insertion porin family [Picosynechococcus sp. OG1]SMQ80268.1 outer membrane protein insertion porin family [Synechococcus sp. 7002]
MQKQQNLDYFSPQALALWAAIASLGVMSPAHAEPRSEGSHSDPLVPTATQVVVPALPVEDVAPTAAPASQTPAPQSENLAQSSTQAVTSPVAQAQEAPQDSNLPQLYAQQQGNPNAQQANPNEPRVLVAEIQINGVGDNVELEQRIIRAIETQAGRPTTVSQIRNDVNRVYATGLFANVVATPEDTPLGVRVTFDVVPNPVLTDIVVQALPLEGSQNITPPEVVDNIFSDRYGEIINLNDFQEGSNKLQQLQQWYQDNGYDLAKVIGIDEPSADGVVTLVVVEGVIEDIQVNFINADNESVDGKTRDFIITREMELKPGDVFRRDVAQRDLQRVFGLGLFEDVQLDFTTGTEDPTQAVLNLNVIEGNTGSIAAGGGISSASGFFGSVSYQQQNLGGNNQRLAAEFQLGQRDALFDLSFTDPWIAGDPYRTSYSVNAFRRRSISLIFDGGENDVDLQDSGDRPRINRIGGGVTFSRPLSKDVFGPSEWRASLGFDYNRVRITNADGDTEFIDEAGNQLSFSDNGIDDIFALSLNVVRDKRTSFDGATRGSITRFGTDQTIPIGSGSILFNRLRASHSIYMDSPIKLPSFGSEEKPHTLAFNIQGGAIIGDLPPYEAFSLGGSNSVRGFEEGDLGSGRNYIQATAEYRFPIFSAVGGALFADYATDLGSGDDVPGDPAGTRGKPGNGFGYGIGVRVNSPLGPIRVDYGLNDQGDSRIHFGIGERF